jgi:hypothetical protein
MEEKYLKYKLKYFQYKSMTGGTSVMNALVKKGTELAASAFNKFAEKKEEKKIANELRESDDNHNKYTMNQYLQSIIRREREYVNSELQKYNQYNSRSIYDTLYRIVIIGNSATIIATQSSKIGEVKTLLKCISKTDKELVFEIDNSEYKVETRGKLIDQLIDKLAEILLQKVENLPNYTEEPYPELNFNFSFEYPDYANRLYFIIINYYETALEDFKNKLRDTLKYLLCYKPKLQTLEQ